MTHGQPLASAGPLLPALLLLAAWAVPLMAQDDAATEVPIVAVSPKGGNADSLVSEWEQPRRPATLGSRERQQVLQQVSGGGPGGVPLGDELQLQGRAPAVRHLILTVKRPWYVQRAFLAAEGVQRVDARSTMRFDESVPGRAIVGLNLVKGNVYLVDFLLNGEGNGDYELTTDAGIQTYADPDGSRTHVLVALDVQSSGWTELSLGRKSGAFDLHSVEVTLALGPEGEGSGR